MYRKLALATLILASIDTVASAQGPRFSVSLDIGYGTLEMDAVNQDIEDDTYLLDKTTHSNSPRIDGALPISFRLKYRFSPYWDVVLSAEHMNASAEYQFQSAKGSVNSRTSLSAHFLMTGIAFRPKKPGFISILALLGYGFGSANRLLSVSLNGISGPPFEFSEGYDGSGGSVVAATYLSAETHPAFMKPFFFTLRGGYSLKNLQEFRGQMYAFAEGQDVVIRDQANSPINFDFSGYSALVGVAIGF